MFWFSDRKDSAMFDVKFMLEAFWGEFSSKCCFPWKLRAKLSEETTSTPHVPHKEVDKQRTEE